MLEQRDLLLVPCELRLTALEDSRDFISIERRERVVQMSHLATSSLKKVVNEARLKTNKTFVWHGEQSKARSYEIEIPSMFFSHCFPTSNIKRTKRKFFHFISAVHCSAKLFSWNIKVVLNYLTFLGFGFPCTFQNVIPREVSRSWDGKSYMTRKIITFIHSQIRAITVLAPHYYVFSCFTTYFRLGDVQKVRDNFLALTYF